MKTALALVLLFCAAVPASAASLYVRGGVAIEQSDDTTLVDRDCASTTPPALFGCVDGADGRPLAARGDYGTVQGWELAFGTTLGARARLEAAWTSRDLDLGAGANFTGVHGPQPVRAEGRSQALLFNGVWTFQERADVQPFVLAGVGVARNALDPVVYSFPSIGAGSVTITQGGTSTGLAWNAGAGVSMRMSSSLFIDVALRYTDLGEVGTDAGDATIVRPTRTLVLAIDGTRGDAETLGVSIGVRWKR